MNFKVGDRVISISSYDDVEKGVKGTVVDVGHLIGVEWNNWNWGHNCDGHCEQGKGWYVSERSIKKIDEKVTNWRNRIENEI